MLEFPLVRRDDLAEAFRPAGASSAHSALRTLRQNGWLGQGIELPLRGGAGGKLVGRPVLYSALGRDAAILARRGQKDAARGMADAAAQLEDSYRDQIANSLAELRFVELRFPRFLFVALRSSADLAKALGGMAREGEAARAGSTSSTPSFFDDQRGHVTKVEREIVQVLSGGGAVFQVPRALVGALDLDFPSAPLIVRSGRWSPTAATIEVEPGLDVDDQVALAPAELPSGEWSPFTSAPKEPTQAHLDFLRAIAQSDPRPRPTRAP